MSTDVPLKPKGAGMPPLRSMLTTTGEPAVDRVATISLAYGPQAGSISFSVVSVVLVRAVPSGRTV
jgi:hypothetical protein